MKSSMTIIAALLLFYSNGPVAFEHKGSVKPNGWLADFNKHDEAYYLSVDQLRVGYTQTQVIEQYGKKYSIVETKLVDGKKLETWKFTSYRARQFSDPVDRFVFVYFIDGLVVNATEKPVDNSLSEVSLVKAESAAAKLKQLQELLDQKLITQEEFETKRKDILSKL
jgi:hypothetical protein